MVSSHKANLLCASGSFKFGLNLGFNSSLFRRPTHLGSTCFSGSVRVPESLRSRILHSHNLSQDKPKSDW